MQVVKSDQLINILAVSGSLKANSVNTAVLEAVEKMLPSTVKMDWFKAIGELPHFNPDNDREGIQPAGSVSFWRKAISNADAIIICTPEYAFGVPGVLKNALDWIVSSGEFTNKPVWVISASPMYTGGDKAHASLTMTLNMMGAHVVEKASLMIPFIKTKMNVDGIVNDRETLSVLKEALDGLLSAVSRDI